MRAPFVQRSILLQSFPLQLETLSPFGWAMERRKLQSNHGLDYCGTETNLFRFPESAKTATPGKKILVLEMRTSR
jgi:hypothetical protein